MYKGFNIELTKEFFQDKYSYYYKIGDNLELENRNNVHGFLDEYIKNGIIDGNKLLAYNLINKFYYILYL